MVFDVQKVSDAFFVIFLHVQHKLSAGPFYIPAKGKRPVKFMHHSGFKGGQILFTHGETHTFLIANGEQVFHPANIRKYAL